MWAIPSAFNAALQMHATMLGVWPPILYWQPDSVATMHRIWALRADGIPVYFTMDAGPNVKLIFEARHAETLRTAFPTMEIITPFPHGDPRTEETTP